VIDWVVAPVDQVFPVAEDEVSVMEVPGQNVAGPLMVGIVAALTVCVQKAAALEQVPFEPVTEYVVSVNGLTVIVWVVAPVDQR
jgi:hypothetical protein